MTTIKQLQSRFAHLGCLSFSELSPDFVAIQVRTDFSVATIALQGAHVMNWQPNGEMSVIWLSPQAKYAQGKSIRGGVPLCWPWFGPHPANPAFPGHGFARIIPWSLLNATQLPDGRVSLEFEPVLEAGERVQWPHATTVRYGVTVGQALDVDLTTSNTGDSTCQLGQALHTYFEVGDIRETRIKGLAGCTYIDKVAGGTRQEQVGAVTFTGETDRIYLDTAGCCIIEDPVLKRNILVTSSGSRSTVVWTPWQEKAAKMGDFGPDGYLRMVCLETANAADDVIMLAPGATHRMAAQYRIVPA
jgi:glucose-6-phosphate 1-epimerase